MIDDPGARVRGADPSLEKGVEVLLKELEKNPRRNPSARCPPT